MPDQLAAQMSIDDGAVSGIIEFDVELGILVRSSAETTMKISMGGIQMPVTSTVVTEILP